MRYHRSELLQLVAWGELGLFTKAEFRTDRVTHPVMPPTAAKGLVRAIFFHPEADVHAGEPSRLGVEIQRIHVLNPIRTLTMRVNEVQDLPRADCHMDVDQRQTSLVLLKDPKYRVEFTYVSPDAPIAKKAAEIFKRRLTKGQTFDQPCFGRRRYVAFVREATDEDVAPWIDIDLGRLPWHIDYLPVEHSRLPQRRMTTFEGRLERGILHVPSYIDAMAKQGKQVLL